VSAAAARATTRHSALRHRLPHTETANATTATWIRDRVALYARTAGLQIPHIAVTPGELQARLGRRSPRRLHLAGWADWTQRPGTVLVDLAQLPTLAAADLVCAHEVAHLLLQRTGHPPALFTAAQHLIDTAAAPAAAPAAATDHAACGQAVGPYATRP